MKRTKETRFRPLTEIERLRIGLVLVWLFVWLILGVAGGCTQTEVEDNDIPFHALKDVEAGFNLHVLDSQTTRSATGDTLQTRAEKALDNTQETKISTLWIGQYDAATGSRMFSQYLESVDDDKVVNVKLKQSNNSSSKSHIWFVANSGNPEAAGEIAEEEALKKHVLTYSSTDDGLPASDLCGMTGMWEGIVKEGGMKDLTVNLTRLVAKITFTYTIGGSDFTFTPSSVTLNSVPDKLQIAAPEKQLTNITYKTYKGNNSVTTQCWYLPENMAGTATGDDAVESAKKKTGKGVSDATYIELTGKAVQGGVTYDKVTFRFYPGAGENNYDIIRNSHYTVNVTLVGIDISDERITVGEIPPVGFDTEKIPAEKGGEKKVQVTARPGQEWSFDMPQWLSALIEGKTVSSGATVTHQGPYQLNFQAAEANPKAEERSVEFPIHINGEDQKVTITQSGSEMKVEAEISLEATSGTTGSASFTATKGLLWDAVLSGTWLSWATGSPAVPGAEATGSSQNLQVKSLEPNPSATERTGGITVKAGASVTEADYTELKKEIRVTQVGSTVTGSTMTVSAVAANGLESSFMVTPGLSWVAGVTDGSWITLTTTSGGPATTSPESVAYDVAINPNEASRTGNITVRAGDASSGPTGVITVKQEGSLFSVIAPTETIPTDGSNTVTGSVSATTGLAWIISPETSNNITVSPTSGTGNATLTFTGTENTGAERTGSFTLSANGASPTRELALSVTQEADEPAATIDKLQVCKTEGPLKKWSDADLYCSNLIAEGKEDWYLPSKDQLVTMYNNKSSLETGDFTAFEANYYWANTSNGRAGHWVVRFTDGQAFDGYAGENYLGHVRCVRNK